MPGSSSSNGRRSADSTCIREEPGAAIGFWARLRSVPVTPLQRLGWRFVDEQVDLAARRGAPLGRLCRHADPAHPQIARTIHQVLEVLAVSAVRAAIRAAACVRRLQRLFRLRRRSGCSGWRANIRYVVATAGLASASIDSPSPRVSSGGRGAPMPASARQ